MKFPFYGFVLIALSACSSQSPKGVYILPGNLGPDFMRPCSRDTPAGVTEFWVPDTDKVTAMQLALVPYAKKNWPNIDISKYIVQAVGIVRDGKREILGNYIHSDYLVSGSAHDPMPDLSMQVINFCDGGEMFFGVNFSPTENQIINMWINNEL